MRIDKDQVGKRAYAHIYLSPHLDDVVLGCGGRIARQVQEDAAVLVVTAFSGGADGTSLPVETPFVPFTNMQERRQEDETALTTLGVDHLWLGYDEAPGRDPRYRAFTALTSHVLESEAPLRAALLADMAAICQQGGAAEIYTPLGIGNHVDHQLLFDIGTQLQEHRHVQGEVVYYEEVPYVFIPHLLKRRLWALGSEVVAGGGSLGRQRGQMLATEIWQTYKGIANVKLIREHLMAPQRLFLLLYVFYSTLVDLYGLPRHRRSRPRLRLRAEVVEVGRYLETKLAAVAAYTSQITALFDSLEAFRQGMESYALSIDGRSRHVERYWRIRRGEGDAE